MKNHNWHIIYNPHAAGGRYLLQIQDIVEWLSQHSVNAELHKTQHPHHATEIAKQLQIGQPSTIIAAGGDGTITEVMNGIMQHPDQDQIRMGLLPLGTGNDFLKDFGVHSVDQALERIITGNTSSIDIGKITILEPEEMKPFYFMNMIGTGVIVEGARLRRDHYAWTGKWGYHFAFFHLLTQLKSLPTSIRINDEKEVHVHSPVTGICNSQYTGHGMRLSPLSDCKDGKLEIIYTEQMSAWTLLFMFLGLSSGKHIRHPKVHYQKFETTELKWEGLDQFMVDGEVKTGSKIKIEILPHSLSILL